MFSFEYRVRSREIRINPAFLSRDKNDFFEKSRRHSEGISANDCQCGKSAKLISIISRSEVSDFFFFEPRSHFVRVNVVADEL